MMLLTIVDEIQRFARKYEMRLDYHVNPLAIQLLDNSKDIRCLKRLKPYDLVKILDKSRRHFVVSVSINV
jgi:hypothetical protein